MVILLNYTGSPCSILFIFILFDVMYAVEMENNNKSHEPRISKGVSDFIWLYVIHIEDETIFKIENTKE